MKEDDPTNSREEQTGDDIPDTHPMFANADADVEEDDEADDGFWSGEDIERAYQEAVTALDHLEQTLPMSGAIGEAEDGAEDDADSVQSLNDFPGAKRSGKALEQPQSDADVVAVAESRLQPKSIIEAALFVGGMPLTIKRLAGVLRDEFGRDYIERAIDELNLHYDDQNRPYEIRLEEGGYRMVLRSEFESVRNKSYGFGPKEVRLSQEALEVLALVAYRQPISREDIEKAGKSNPNGVLRQLLRREIIGLERTGKKAKDVTYHTTARFLQIFGLANLNELPKSEDLNFK